MAATEGKMQGWLYLIRYNRFGLQYSRKRYFTLEDHCLKRLKSVPTSDKEVHLSLSLFLSHACMHLYVFYGHILLLQD